jgi:2,3-bisphosphoglycerate-independent phosphoglycerate mutase
MDIVRDILSVLTLAVLIADVFLTVRNHRRSIARNATLVQYVDKTMDSARVNILRDVNAVVDPLKAAVEDMSKGIVPDYEEAKKAAEATNEFHRGIANILNYNEMDSLRRMREAEQSGGEVE